MLHRRRPFALAPLAALTLALAACERQITDPVPSSRRPSLDHAPLPAAVFARDLGVLPGDARSEATYVSADGATVYGYSYATESPTPRRGFRWTSATGMQEVASIPSPVTYPLPTITPPPDGAVLPLAANAKGEATGIFCRVFFGGGAEGEYRCPSPPPWGQHERAFRYSRGGGLQDLDSFVPIESGGGVNRSYGLAINKWGHVAGMLIPNADDEWRAMLWTPIDSLRLVGGFVNFQFGPPVDVRQALLNDNDRVVFATYSNSDERVFAYEPGYGRRRLRPPVGLGGFDNDDFESYSAALAQNNGAHVVGRSLYNFDTGRVNEFGEPVLEQRERAVRWTLPALSRAAFPQVNANPYGGTTSTVSLSRNGGQYYQTYRATQTGANGPYVEHIDWGDGKSSRRTRSSITADAYQRHSYTKTGTYWVRVYVKDAGGHWGVSERRVTVVS